MSPRPCSSVSKPAEELSHNQPALSKQKPFCIPELVRAAFSSWPSLATAGPWPQPLTPLRTRAQVPFPQTSMTHWHTGARVPAPLGASIQICHFKAAACRPCLHGCNGAEKVKCWGAGKKKERGKPYRQYVGSICFRITAASSLSRKYWPGWSVQSHAATDGFCLTIRVPALGVARNKGYHALWCSYSAT